MQDNEESGLWVTEFLDPSRIDDLVAVTIEDFLIHAEKDVEVGEEPIETGPALIELAAASVAEVVFEYERDPQEVVAMVQARLSAILRAYLERCEAAQRSH